MRQVHEEMGLTSVFVTHDQEEALELADRVVVMNNARIEQIGTAREVYDHPATPFVCEFMGHGNQFDCVIEGGYARFGGLSVPNLVADARPGKGTAYIRPHEFVLLPEAGGDGMRATVKRLTRTGAMTAIDCDFNGRLVEATALDVPPGIAPGATVRLQPRAAHAYPVG